MKDFTITQVDEEINEKQVHIDEAIEATGHGAYNYLALTACSLIIGAVALDMFAFSVVVPVSSCDLEMNLAIRGYLVSVPFAGLLFAYPWGYYADTRGRKRVLMLSTSVGFTFAALGSFAPNWETLMAFKLVGCSFSSAAFTLTLTYLGESVGEKHKRQYLTIVTSINMFSDIVCFVAAFLIIPLSINLEIPLLHINFSSWRLFNLVLAIPMGIGALMMMKLEESPKFLSGIGEKQQALIVLQKMYEMNGGAKGQYPVVSLKASGTSVRYDSLWQSLRLQTAPIFKPPLLWRTLQIYYILIVCCATGNVVYMWHPTIVNAFLNDASEGNYGNGLCDKVVKNLNESSIGTDLETCDSTLSYMTLTAGILYGVLFTSLNLLITKFMAYRKTVMIIIFSVSFISLILMDVIRQPLSILFFFTLFQGTMIGLGIIASFIVDIYPTTYSGLVTCLGMMMGRFASLIGVNLMGIVIIDYCRITFYFWAVFVFSGGLVCLLLPSDKPNKEINET